MKPDPKIVPRPAAPPTPTKLIDISKAPSAMEQRFAAKAERAKGGAA